MMQDYLWQQQHFMLTAKYCRKNYWELQMKFSVNNKNNNALQALIFTKHMGLMSLKLVTASILCLYGKAAGNISSVAAQK